MNTYAKLLVPYLTHRMGCVNVSHYMVGSGEGWAPKERRGLGSERQGAAPLRIRTRCPSPHLCPRGCLTETCSPSARHSWLPWHLEWRNLQVMVNMAVGVEGIHGVWLFKWQRVCRMHGRSSSPLPIATVLVFLALRLSAFHVSGSWWTWGCAWKTRPSTVSDGLRVTGTTLGSPSAVLFLRRPWGSLRTEESGGPPGEQVQLTPSLCLSKSSRAFEKTVG